MTNESKKIMTESWRVVSPRDYDRGQGLISLNRISREIPQKKRQQKREGTLS